MNSDQHRAIDRVLRAGNHMAQGIVAPEDRPVCLELLRLGFIVELTGAHSGRAYWTTTRTGRAEWAKERE